MLISINQLQSLNYIPVITKPTRFAPVNAHTQPSLLDHFWLNFFDCNLSGILLSDISDHNTVFIHLHIATNSDKKIKLTFRCHDDLSMELFRTKLINVNWHNVLVGNVNRTS